MRWVLLLCLSLCINLTFAQNAAFFSFGMEKSEIDSLIASKEYYHSQVTKDADGISNQMGPNRTLSYSFKNERLWQITDIRLYNDPDDKKNKKQVDDVISAFQDYIKLIGGQSKTISSQNGKRHYAILLKDRIMELEEVHDKGSKETQLYLRSTSRQYGPRAKTEEFALSIENSKK